MAEAELTIDQLAQRTGMTVRNIRAHQSRGLLPPPAVRGRTGYYGAAHVARIELIKELQADGFNLDLIRRLLVDAPEAGGELLRFTRALHAPFVEEEPQVVEAAELAERFGSEDPKLLERAQALGLVRPLGGGRYEEVTPALGRAGAELVRLGIPPERAMEVVERLRREGDRVARVFVQLFLDEVWEPFAAAGHPEQRWPEVADALERLRPLASESMLAVFQLAMSDAVEQAFGREVQRMTGSGERSSRRRRRS
jgi:DNA-binding transcriptional MerR regulator